MKFHPQSAHGGKMGGAEDKSKIVGVGHVLCGIVSWVSRLTVVSGWGLPG